jgi:two-component system, chemotaxis family, CheB/CheR fusion protein
MAQKKTAVASRAKRPRAKSSARVSKRDHDDLHVVGIGGSSGSLEALVQLLGKVEANSGAGFVFVQHLDPTHKSMLADIVSRSTAMPVAQARDGDRVLPDHLYIIPPQADLSISRGMLRLTPRSASAHHLPIDSFLQALAQDFDSRAIGIILSGSGTDGSHGLQAIKAAGGITIVQEPCSAKFDGMPRAALLTGDADLVLTPEQIGEHLNWLRRHGFRFPEAAAPGDLESQELGEILRLVSAATGSDLSFCKPSNLMRRIHRRMLLNR